MLAIYQSLSARLDTFDLASESVDCIDICLTPGCRKTACAGSPFSLGTLLWLLVSVPPLGLRVKEVIHV